MYQPGEGSVFTIRTIVAPLPSRYNIYGQTFIFCVALTKMGLCFGHHRTTVGQTFKIEDHTVSSVAIDRGGLCWVKRMYWIVGFFCIHSLHCNGSSDWTDLLEWVFALDARVCISHLTDVLKGIPS